MKILFDNLMTKIGIPLEPFGVMYRTQRGQSAHTLFNGLWALQITFPTLTFSSEHGATMQ